MIQCLQPPSLTPTESLSWNHPWNQQKFWVGHLRLKNASEKTIKTIFFCWHQIRVWRSHINSNLWGCFWRCIWMYLVWVWLVPICDGQKKNLPLVETQWGSWNKYTIQHLWHQLFITKIWNRPQPSTPNPRLNHTSNHQNVLFPSFSIKFFVSKKNPPSWQKKTNPNATVFWRNASHGGLSVECFAGR